MCLFKFCKKWCNGKEQTGLNIFLLLQFYILYFNKTHKNTLLQGNCIENAQLYAETRWEMRLKALDGHFQQYLKLILRLFGKCLKSIGDLGWRYSVTHYVCRGFHWLHEDEKSAGKSCRQLGNQETRFTVSPHM